MSKFNKEKIIGFFKKNGFYICLAVCLLGVGAAVIAGLGAGSAETPGAVEEPAATKQPVSVPARTQAPAAQQAGTVTVPSEQSPAPSAEAENEPESAARQPKVKVTLSMPLDGEIVRAFSGDTLVYNPTLNMWLTHNGIDIASKNGGSVTAALAGEVSSVEPDETGSLTVTIAHTDGAKTVYSGLSEAGVEVGGLVNAGSPIGKAGIPAFEADLGEHLHFEYIVDGKYKDPAEYIKK